MSRVEGDLAPSAGRLRVVACRSGAGGCRLIDVLASELSVPAACITLRRDENGKPRVAGPTTELRFSVSHALDLTLMAFAHGVDVGVDVEHMKRDVTGWALWEEVLSADEIVHLPAVGSVRNRALLQAWVGREAILKAAGVGLAVDPRCVELDADGRIAAVPASFGTPNMWSVEWLTLDGFVAAVAWTSPGAGARLGLELTIHDADLSDPELQ